MRNQTVVRPVLGVPLVAAGLLASTIAMRPSPPPASTLVRTVDARECAAFMDDSIPAGDDSLSAHLVLNTARAVSGQWKLTLVGDQNTCTGGVYVGRKKR